MAPSSVARESSACFHTEVTAWQNITGATVRRSVRTPATRTVAAGAAATSSGVITGSAFGASPAATAMPTAPTGATRKTASTSVRLDASSVTMAP